MLIYVNVSIDLSTRINKSQAFVNKSAWPNSLATMFGRRLIRFQDFVLFVIFISFSNWNVYLQFNTWISLSLILKICRADDFTAPIYLHEQ